MKNQNISPKTAKHYRFSIIIISAIVLVIVVVASTLMGTVGFTLSELWGVITGAYAKEDFVYRIVINIRLARTITGVCVGMNLAVAGVLLQGILPTWPTISLVSIRCRFCGCPYNDCNTWESLPYLLRFRGCGGSNDYLSTFLAAGRDKTITLSWYCRINLIKALTLPSWTSITTF